MIIAKRRGKAIITARLGNKKYTCKVTVKKKYNINNYLGHTYSYKTSDGLYEIDLGFWYNSVHASNEDFEFKYVKSKTSYYVLGMRSKSNYKISLDFREKSVFVNAINLDNNSTFVKALFKQAS